MNRKERRKKAKLQRKGGTRGSRGRPPHLESGGHPPVAPRASPAKLFEAAVADLKAVRLDRAEKKLRQYVAARPDHAEAFHLLGLTVYQAGRVEEAAGLIGQAARMDAANAACHSNLGVALNVLGRPAEGEAACRRALEIDPDNAEALNNLGVALNLQGRLDEAGRSFLGAVERAPGYAEAHINLGNVRRRQGKPAESTVSYRAAAEQAPGNATAWTNLGAALRELGELEEALAQCRRAVELAPQSAEAHNNLGNVHMSLGDLAAAEGAFRRAVELKPGNVEARINLGGVLFALDRFEDAEDAYRQALEADPGGAAAYAYNSLGVTLLAASRLDEAVRAFRRALDLDPGLAEAWYNLAQSGPAALNEADIAAIGERLKEDGLAGGERIALHFALGETHNFQGAAALAFAHFQTGNELRQADLAGRGHVFDAAAHDRLIDGIVAAWPADRLSQGEGAGSPSELPVFVVGMPRSGTTLVEQIAASHPDVFGAGEMDRIAPLAADPGPAGAAEYLSYLETSAGGAARVIDKTPLNFLHLGAIALMFPKARIIHCRRDPLDVCLSCYFQNFVTPHPWSTDLAGLGRYYRAYERLMDHWRRVLPGRMLEVDYADVVGGLEGAARRIVDYLDLAWDDACLAFHESRRPVKSAANWQVRRPVHASSLGRWRAYDEWLGPLKESLGE